MLANPSIHVCICVPSLFAIVCSPPVITFIEKGFHSFRLQRKGADNRDRKIGPPSGAHFSHEQRSLSED
jgi:hypothetical protein